MNAVFLMAITLLSVSSDAVRIFEEANAAYLQGQYAEAQEKYSQLNTSQGINSPALFYNLANAYYKQGHLGAAILYYEAALAQDPNFEAARKNLQTALGETKRSLPLVDPRQTSTNPMLHYYPLSPIQSLYLVHFFLVAAIALLVIRKWRHSRRYIWFGRLALCLAVIFFVLTLAGNNTLLAAPKLAVAQLQEVPVYFSTSESDQPRFLLYEGDRVLVDRIEGDWVRLHAHGGERGWALKDNLGIVNYQIW